MDVVHKCMDIMDVSTLGKNEIKHNTGKTCSILNGNYELNPAEISSIKNSSKVNKFNKVMPYLDNYIIYRIVL